MPGSSTTIVAAPTELVVPIATARAHLRIATSSQDTRLRSLLDAARSWIEDFTGRSTTTATWDLHLDCFPGEIIQIPYPPLISVTAASFLYVNGSGDSTQVPEATYNVNTSATPGEVELAYGKTWPAPRSERQPITLRFVAGYGSSSSDLPPAFTNAALLYIENLYDHSGTSDELTQAAERLLRPYVVRWY